MTSLDMVLAAVGMRSLQTINLHPIVDIDTARDHFKPIVSMASGFAIVTPASRGLGFAFARQLLAQTNLPVIATARRDCDKVRSDLINSVPASQSADERLQVFKVDVTGKSHTSATAPEINPSKEPPR